jgi:ABC-type transport system involved in Fe-S cluster assembly fused permease/ATPase subunit
MSNWETLKEKGNQDYKEKKYHSAISLYTDAICKQLIKLTQQHSTLTQTFSTQTEHFASLLSKNLKKQFTT